MRGPVFRRPIGSAWGRPKGAGATTAPVSPPRVSRTFLCLPAGGGLSSENGGECGARGQAASFGRRGGAGRKGVGPAGIRGGGVGRSAFAGSFNPHRGRPGRASGRLVSGGRRRGPVRRQGLLLFHRQPARQLESRSDVGHAPETHHATDEESSCGAGGAGHDRSELFDPSADDGSGVGGDQSDGGPIAGTEAAFLGGVDSRWAALGDFAVGGRCTGGEGSGGEEIGGTSD